jgi:hypothetical protein
LFGSHHFMDRVTRPPAGQIATELKRIDSISRVTAMTHEVQLSSFALPGRISWRRAHWRSRLKIANITALVLLVATSAFAGKVIKRGAAVSSAKPVALTAVLESPRDYTKTPVVVEGVIEKSCTNMGCWMELAPEGGGKSVRVTFEDEKFFIPLQAKGMQARAEGLTKVHTLSKDEADHLTEEGATLKRNEDGSADEVSFVATGVELKRP